MCDTLDCRTALELINRSDRLSAGERDLLQRHISACASCAVAGQLESHLRAALVPEHLPTPSPLFEGRLKAKLGLNARPRPVWWLRWSWIPVLLALTVVAQPWMQRLGYWAYGTVVGLAGRMVGWLSSLNPSLEPELPLALQNLQVQGHTLALNFLLAGVIVLTGALALGLVLKE